MFCLFTAYNYAPAKTITIILGSLRFSETLAADEKKQVFVYIEHLKILYNDGAISTATC
jgi:hypothetical protein